MSTKLNDKIKQSLNIIGFILSALGGIGYIITIFILVFGVGNLQFELLGKDGVFFIVGMVFGLVIRSGFYIQGVKFAQEEYKTILQEYYNLRVVDKKDKRTQSYEFKLAIEIVISTTLQVAIFMVSGLGIIYLAGFEGMNNPVYIGNAISNLFMFAGFGFLALNSAYEKYHIYKIPYIQEKTRLLKIEQASN
jgi:hypothetical protein